MSNPIINFFTYLYNTFLELFRLIKELTSSHPCSKRNCDCAEYTDEELFENLRKRASLGSYCDEVLSSDILNRKLKCSVCNHLRSTHGTLSDRVLTADAIPNGGAVHVEQLERERVIRRERRFATEDTLRKRKPEEEISINDMKIGEGRAVVSGDQVQVHYDGFLKKSMEKFESSRQEDPLVFTVGEGRVIKGWEVGIVGAKVGGRRRIEIPAHLAYGRKLICGERDVDLVFDLYVLSILSS